MLLMSHRERTVPLIPPSPVLLISTVLSPFFFCPTRVLIQGHGHPGPPLWRLPLDTGCCPEKGPYLVHTILSHSASLALGYFYFYQWLDTQLAKKMFISWISDAVEKLLVEMFQTGCHGRLWEMPAGLIFISGWQMLILGAVILSDLWGYPSCCPPIPLSCHQSLFVFLWYNSVWTFVLWRPLGLIGATFRGAAW